MGIPNMIGNSGLKLLMFRRIDFLSALAAAIRDCFFSCTVFPLVVVSLHG